MTDPLELCKGLAKYVHNSVSELRGRTVVEMRGPSHPIYQHETEAENAGLYFIQKESERNPDLKIGLGFELLPKWYAVQKGVVSEMDVPTLKEFKPDICILSDPIDGSKADVPVYQSRFGKPIQEGGIYEVFTTAIAFHPDRPTLKDAVAAALQRWDGKQFFANQYESLVGFQGEEAIIKSQPLDEIGLHTKFYTGGHYSHVSPMATFVIETLLEEIGFPEKQSPGVRSTGSTTYDMLQPTMTRSIAFDIRNDVKKALEKYGVKMRRGAYSHDFAPPAFFAKRAGAFITNLDGTEMNYDLFVDQTASYFEAPPGEAGKTVLRVLRDKVLPQIPEKAKEWKIFWEKSNSK